MVTNNERKYSDNAATAIENIVPKSAKDVTETACTKYVVKFSSVKCGPCRALSLWLKSEYSAKEAIPIYNVDVEDSNMDALCGYYNVQSIPRTVFVDKNTDKTDSVVGFRPSEIGRLLDRYFPGNK